MGQGRDGTQTQVCALVTTPYCLGERPFWKVCPATGTTAVSTCSPGWELGGQVTVAF